METRFRAKFRAMFDRLTVEDAQRELHIKETLDELWQQSEKGEKVHYPFVKENIKDEDHELFAEAILYEYKSKYTAVFAANKQNLMARFGFDYELHRFTRKSAPRNLSDAAGCYDLRAMTDFACRAIDAIDYFEGMEDMSETAKLCIYHIWEAVQHFAHTRKVSVDFRKKALCDMIQCNIGHFCEDRYHVEELTGQVYIELANWNCFDSWKELRNRVANRIRISQKEKDEQTLPIEQFQEYGTPDPQLNAFTEKENIEAIANETVRHLKGHERELFQLYWQDHDLYFYGGNIEVAERLGWTPATVGVVKHRLKQKLS